VRPPTRQVQRNDLGHGPNGALRNRDQARAKEPNLRGNSALLR
jgi:hypothetical protein